MSTFFLVSAFLENKKMRIKIKFSLSNYCLGFWWGDGSQVGGDEKHLFAIVFPMVGILFLWS